MYGFVGQLVRHDGIKRRAVVNKEHTDVGVLFFQVREGSIESHTDGVVALCGVMDITACMRHQPQLLLGR